MTESIAISEVQAMIDAAVAAAVAPLQERILKLTMGLDEAKRTIALLRSQLFGRKVEKSDVILNVEGQQLIDAAWLIAK